MRARLSGTESIPGGVPKIFRHPKRKSGRRSPQEGLQNPGSMWTTGARAMPEHLRTTPVFNSSVSRGDSFMRKTSSAFSNRQMLQEAACTFFREENHRSRDSSMFIRLYVHPSTFLSRPCQRRKPGMEHRGGGQ